MHRFFAPPESTAGHEIQLPPNEVKHAVGVLRIRPADRAVILNGMGEEILVEVIDVARRSVLLRVLHRQRIPQHPCRITLVQGVPKARVMATEPLPTPHGEAIYGPAVDFVLADRARLNPANLDDRVALLATLEEAIDELFSLP